MLGLETHFFLGSKWQNPVDSNQCGSGRKNGQAEFVNPKEIKKKKFFFF